MPKEVLLVFGEGDLTDERSSGDIQFKSGYHVNVDGVSKEVLLAVLCNDLLENRNEWNRLYITTYKE